MKRTAADVRQVARLGDPTRMGRPALSSEKAALQPNPITARILGFRQSSFPMSVKGTYRFGNTDSRGEQRLPDLRHSRPHTSAAGRGVPPDDVLWIPRFR